MLHEGQFDWYTILERAIAIEKQIPGMKRQAFADIQLAFPGISYRNFGNLRRAYLTDKLTAEVAGAMAVPHRKIKLLETEAMEYRRQSDELLAREQAADKRRVLDPQVDPIPPGPYPKLRNCTVYPLRLDCNFGENDTAKWDRCEFMQYDQSCKRWHCTCKK